MDGVAKKQFDAYLIVSHGLFSRLFLMRYFRWRYVDTVEGGPAHPPSAPAPHLFSVSDLVRERGMLLLLFA